MRALIIEDDRGVASFLERGLRENGFGVDVSFDGDSGYAVAARNEHDIIVLDLMLPGRDGFSILRDIRRSGQTTPVICLTARDAVDDRVTGLDFGADDYLVKPFSFAELLARIRALMRRGTLLADNPIQIGDLSIDIVTRQVQRAGRRIDLSAREFSLLEYLARHAGQVVSRTMLLEKVWDMNRDPQTNVVDVHINRLRKKVDHGFSQALIHTMRGVGYVMREHADEDSGE
ncbi:MAG: response regulator transcription factor [Phycisphaerales bacterium]|nr:response regulator transcription factor [Phycisphaerales bacterium]MCB9856213.1 response regulator transcription factor [Phycisphaerales bacterium]MCB9863348.1 response regulator transcription factor [Phycisphaerales bacterium]